MSFDAALNYFANTLHQLGPTLDAGLLIFARTLAFIQYCSIFNRKDVAFNIKLAFAIFLTMTLLWIVPIEPSSNVLHNLGAAFFIQLIINITLGALLGFVGDLLLKTLSSAGSTMNAQIGLSSAMVFDPSTKTQVMILDRLFAFIGLLLFIHLGGFYWLIQGLERSFQVFPLYNPMPDVINEINLDYLTTVSSNIINVGTQLVSPIIIVTMAVDIILGIVNRTAQQMPVFQMSFALKPSIGVAVLLATLPIMLQSMVNFLTDYSQLY